MNTYDVTIVGSGQARLSKMLKPYLDHILQQFGKYDIIDFRGHVMPIRRCGNAIQKGRMLLIWRLVCRALMEGSPAYS